MGKKRYKRRKTENDEGRKHSKKGYLENTAHYMHGI